MASGEWQIYVVTVEIRFAPQSIDNSTVQVLVTLEEMAKVPPGQISTMTLTYTEEDLDAPVSNA